MMKNKCEILLSSTVENDDKIAEWIDEFQKYLSMILKQLIGYEPAIISLPDFSEADPDLSSKKFLIILLTKNDASQDKINKDIDHFYQLVNQYDSLDPDLIYSKRIFKVKVSPVSYEQEPEKVKDILGYKFYQKDGEGLSRIMTPFVNHDIQRNFWLELSELAYNIYKSLEETNALEAISSSAKFVYLCETSPDLLLHRLVVKRELQKLGYVVLPDKSYPSDIDQFKQKIKNDINKCELVIQLIGQFYDEILVDTKYSLAEFQSIVTSEVLKEKPNIKRIVWLYPELEIKDVRQKEFFENLKKEVESKETSDILQTTIEELKNYIIQKLNKKINNIDHNIGPESVLYLIYDYVDAEKAKNIAKEIVNAGYKVVEPDFSGNYVAQRENHVDKLKRFDKAIIFCENGSENWLQMKLMDLLKSAGLGRKKAILGKVLLNKKADIDLNKLKKFSVDIQELPETQEISFDLIQEILQDFREVQMKPSNS